MVVEQGFGWLMLNAWHALGHRNITAARVEFADSLVPELAAALPSSAAHVRAFANRLSKVGRS